MLFSKIQMTLSTRASSSVFHMCNCETNKIKKQPERQPVEFIQKRRISIPVIFVYL